jgi:hypothetical protein
VRNIEQVFGREVDLGAMETLAPAARPHESLPSYLDARDSVLLKNTKRYEPREGYLFAGEIFLLVDHDVFSATEDFAKFA